MLAKLLILTVVALVAPQIVPGVKVKGIESAALIAVVFALLNFLIGWLLHGALALISLPFVLLTFGLFLVRDFGGGQRGASAFDRRHHGKLRAGRLGPGLRHGPTLCLGRESRRMADLS